MPHDYSRSKNSLIGCLGVTLIAFAVLHVSFTRLAPRVRLGQPCILDPERFRPLLLGDSLRPSVGTMQGSDCTGKRITDVEWASSNPLIAEVTDDGLFRGKAVGVFEAIAMHDSVTRTASGFVLPPEWRVRVEPESARMRVGDSLRMVVRAVDASGGALPAVPYSLFTPEFFDPMRIKRSIVNEYSWQDVVEPVMIVARDTGTTTLVGRIGFQQATAKLTIVPVK